LTSNFDRKSPNTPQNTYKTEEYLSQVVDRSWRDHPHSAESTCPAEKAWRHMIRHGAPLQLHIFLAIYNEFSLSPSQNHAFCVVFYPRILLLQCVLTRKTCHGLSSLGVVLGTSTTTRTSVVLAPLLVLVLVLTLLLVLVLLLVLALVWYSYWY
jgi:hypothetical protein